MASYLFRLDDSCPTQDKAKWTTLIELLCSYDVAALIAIVPDNTDPYLCIDPPDPLYWPFVSSLSRYGFNYALHGLNHSLYKHSGRSLVPINTYGEFVGRAYDIQARMIRDAYDRLLSHSIKPTAWVAPAHSFDFNTLRALSTSTDIRVISDGIARNPYSYCGFTWIPQQLWSPTEKKDGVWTICLHPNSLTNHELHIISSFLEVHSSKCLSLDSILETSHITEYKRLSLYREFFFFKRSLSHTIRKIPCKKHQK